MTKKKEFSLNSQKVTEEMYKAIEQDLKEIFMEDSEEQLNEVATNINFIKLKEALTRGIKQCDRIQFLVEDYKRMVKLFPDGEERLTQNYNRELNNIDWNLFFELYPLTVKFSEYVRQQKLKYNFMIESKKEGWIIYHPTEMAVLQSLNFNPSGGLVKFNRKPITKDEFKVDITKDSSAKYFNKYMDSKYVDKWFEKKVIEKEEDGTRTTRLVPRTKYMEKYKKYNPSLKEDVSFNMGNIAEGIEGATTEYATYAKHRQSIERLFWTKYLNNYNKKYTKGGDNELTNSQDKLSNATITKLTALKSACSEALKLLGLLNSQASKTKIKEFLTSNEGYFDKKTFMGNLGEALNKSVENLVNNFTGI